MDTRNNKAEIESVCLTLRAHDVRTIAHLYREAADRELKEELPFLAAQNYESAAWLYRAIGDVYLAEALETKAESVREETRMKKTEEEGA
jgi:predicted nucleotidyltransferase